MIFYKTSAAQNDFLHIETPSAHPGAAAVSGPRDLSRTAAAVCRRHEGAGADGVIFYSPTPEGAAFQIYNRDGSGAELSGNGMTGLCAVLTHLRDLRPGDVIVLNSPAGVRRHRLIERQACQFRFSIEIGPPDFSNTRFFPFLEPSRWNYRHNGVSFYPVSVGNPHVVVYPAPPVPEEELARIGAELESAGIFPHKTNVEFVTGLDGAVCSIFYYERGVGVTQSSSTGSSAVFSVLRKLGVVAQRMTVRAAGGTLELSGSDSIYIENAALLVYKGEYLGEIF